MCTGVCLVVMSGAAPSMTRLGVYSTGLSGGGRAPGRAGLSHCGSRTQLLLGTWDPPGSRIEPVSPALAARFFTTRETPYRRSLQNDIFLSSFTSVALTVTSDARGPIALTVFLEKLHGCHLTRRGGLRGPGVRGRVLDPSVPNGALLSPIYSVT